MKNLIKKSYETANNEKRLIIDSSNHHLLENIFNESHDLK
jgi:hypothetical protein|tara:strand:+ start:383 stop:502 length:120 start_codon:yes stop_codon:yes gene_type:complete